MTPIIAFTYETCIPNIVRDQAAVSKKSGDVYDDDVNQLPKVLAVLLCLTRSWQVSSRLNYGVLTYLVSRSLRIPITGVVPAIRLHNSSCCLQNHHMTLLSVNSNNSRLEYSEVGTKRKSIIPLAIHIPLQISVVLQIASPLT